MSDVSENPLFLPEELIYNILLRLPVKSVLVCTSVCKAWNSFIKSPSFVSSHLSRTISSYKDSGNLLYLLQLVSCSPTQETKTYSFSLRSDDEKLSEYSSIHFPYKHEAGFQVISSCNGLVLLKIDDGRRIYVRLKLILWNPVLRKSVLIVKEKKMLNLCAAGLGLDSRGDYKVLTIIREKMDGEWDGDFSVDLYSLNTNSWKRLHFEGILNWFPGPRINQEMIFLNGAFHLIVFVKSRPLILGLDVDAETFHEIELPECLSRCVGLELSLWACGEALSVIWDKKPSRVLEWQIWVMEKYGVTESWTLLSTVSCKVDAYQFLCRGLVYRNNGSVLCYAFPGANAYAPSLMVSHDLKSQETNLGYFDEKSKCYFLGNYVESLVLMDKGDDLSLVFETDPCNSNDASFNSPSDNAKGISSSSWMKKVVNYVFGILCVKSSDEVSSELGQDLGETSSGAAIQNDNQVDANEDDASLEA